MGHSMKQNLLTGSDRATKARIITRIVLVGRDGDCDLKERPDGCGFKLSQLSRVFEMLFERRQVYDFSQKQVT